MFFFLIKNINNKIMILCYNVKLIIDLEIVQNLKKKHNFFLKNTNKNKNF